jgi:hypothetical protein
LSPSHNMDREFAGLTQLTQFFLIFNLFSSKIHNLMLCLIES